MWFIQGVVKLTEADGDTTAIWWNNQSIWLEMEPKGIRG
jgi:hypothetical protein